jgi:hypothetical protein
MSAQRTTSIVAIIPLSSWDNRHIHRVVVTVQGLRHAIPLHELNPGLVNVEVVQFIGLVS